MSAGCVVQKLWMNLKLVPLSFWWLLAFSTLWQHHSDPQGQRFQICTTSCHLLSWVCVYNLSLPLPFMVTHSCIWGSPQITWCCYLPQDPFLPCLFPLLSLPLLPSKFLIPFPFCNIHKFKDLDCRVFWKQYFSTWNQFFFSGSLPLPPNCPVGHSCGCRHL